MSQKARVLHTSLAEFGSRVNSKDLTMSFATLLVHVEADAASDPRLALAVDLANQFDAQLIGVGAEAYRTAMYGDGGYGAAYAIEAEMSSLEAELQCAKQKFYSAVTSVREGWRWHSSVRFPILEIAAEARAADLVVTSHRHGRGISDYKVAPPGALILQTGRPVLVATPDAVRLNAANVLVAWKDTREARRALVDALPFLLRAKKVHLLEICEDRELVAAATSHLGDVADYLFRHGVTATSRVEVEEKNTPPAVQLLDIATMQEVDLIVAGGYGHSRLQERVFGGFTRALLAQTAKAVLFSH
jgi:nucleotide-binding universal stress UspA family protein